MSGPRALGVSRTYEHPNTVLVAFDREPTDDDLRALHKVLRGGVPFNALAPAEVERLALAVEEQGEAIQAIGKILRHGYESSNPFDTLQRTNRQSLERELGDVRHAIIRLCDAGDLSKAAIHARADEKAVAVRPYLHHQGDSQGGEPA
jgi:hypothetical protein